MSEDIEYPPSLNRTALVVYGKPALLEWLHTVPDGEHLTMDRINLESTVYLVPEDEEDPEVLIESYFERIFEQELLAWCTDTEFWPQDLSLAAFQRLFQVQVATTVFDLGDDDLEVFE